MSQSSTIKTVIAISVTGLLSGFSIAKFQAFGDVPVSATIEPRTIVKNASAIECGLESYAGHKRNQIQLPDFSIDSHEVTNLQFSRFIDATGYITTAERALNADDYPGVDPSLLEPGSAVFVKPETLTSDDMNQWWSFVPGANWRQPEGMGSSIDNKDHYPVVHITFEDATAYADWAGRKLPTEQQWVFAATHLAPTNTEQWHLDKQGNAIANIWQGIFPLRNTAEDGFEGLAPVGCFTANAAQLSDMIGNVWEWTADDFQRNALPTINGSMSGSTLASGENEINLNVQNMANADTAPGVKTIKGGSYLCAGNFCTNYHPAARFPQDASLGTNHLGFRTVSAQSH